MSSTRKAPKGAPRRDGNRGRGPAAVLDDDGRRRGDRRIVDTPVRERRPKSARVSRPARDQRALRPGPATAPMPRVAPAKSTSQAKARAKARKAKAPKVIRVPLRERLHLRLLRLTEIDLNPRTLLARVPFVVLVIGALGVGLAVTLWLSTDAAERSYQLGHVRQTNQALQQQKESLEREVLEAQAAPALAEAARNLGMIPSRDTAHLVQDPGGNWIVVGNPKPAEGVPPPPLNVKLPDEAPPQSAPTRPVETPVRVGVAPAPAPVGAPVPLGAPAPAGAPEVPVPLDHSPAGPVANPLGVPATGPVPGPADVAPGLVIVPVPAPAAPLPAAPLPAVAPAPPGPPPADVAPAPAPAPIPVGAPA